MYTESYILNVCSRNSAVAEILPEGLTGRPSRLWHFYEPLEIQHILSFVVWVNVSLCFLVREALTSTNFQRDIWPILLEKNRIIVLCHIYIIFSNFASPRKKYILHHDSAHAHRLNWNKILMRLLLPSLYLMHSFPFSLKKKSDLLN